MPLTALTEEEQALLDRWLPFHQALARGERRPTTPAQEHFVAVFQGRARAETPHEWAYLKWRRAAAEVPPGGPEPDGPEVPPGQHRYPPRMDEKFDQRWEDPDPPWRR
jgi:hypothetical protein